MSQHRKLLTIITEASIESRLLADLERLGATGYTITEGRGKGRHGARNARWDQSGNIRVEVICEESVGRAIATHLQDAYFQHYAIVLYLSDIEVLRSDRF